MSETPTKPLPGILNSLSAAEANTLDERGIPTKLGRQYRRTKVESGGYDKEKRTVSLAISSEFPVERYYGVEILSHQPGAMRTDRLKNGISLLFNHDYDQQIGRSQSFKLRDDGVLEITNRFGPSDFAREKEADVEADILVDTSLGYIVYEWEITEDKNGVRTYLAVDWEPLENSLVTVPADPTVGVGRASDGEITPKIRSFTSEREADPEDPEGDDEEDDEDDTDGERSAAPVETPSSAPSTSSTTPETQRTLTMADTTTTTDHVAENKARIDGLRAIRTANPKFFSEDALLSAISDGTDVRTAKEKVADAIIASSQRSDVGTVTDQVLDDKAKRQYSLVRAIRHAINQAKPGTFSAKDADAGFEREIDTDLRRSLDGIGAPAGFGAGLLIPSNLPFDPASANRAAGLLGRRSLTAGSSTGSNVTNTVTESNYIEFLRSRNRLMALGAQTLSGIHGLFRIPRQNASASSTWLAELSNATNSDAGLDFITASPKRNSIMGSYTLEMLSQAAIAVEDFLRADQIASKATTREIVGFSGTGGTMPTGLFNLSGIAAILTGASRASNGTVTAGAGGAPLSYVDCNNFEAAISTANADTGTMGWAFTPRTRAALRSTPKIAGGLSDFIWPSSSTMNPDGLQEGPLGYAAGVTTNVPTGFTSNSVSGCHGAALGIWASMMYVEWGVSELIMDPYTGAKNAVYNVIEHELLDIMFRHPEQFAVSTSVVAS